VEAGAKEVSEKDMLDAILFAHEMIKELCEFQEEILKDFPVEKMPFESLEPEVDLVQEVTERAGKALVEAVSIVDKLERYEAIESIQKQVLSHYEAQSFFKNIDGVQVFDQKAYDLNLKFVKMILDDLVTKELRRFITEDKVRPDGRKVDEVRD